MPGDKIASALRSRPHSSCSDVLTVRLLPGGGRNDQSRSSRGCPHYRLQAILSVMYSGIMSL
jgi:hypothetical protein